MWKEIRVNDYPNRNERQFISERCAVTVRMSYHSMIVDHNMLSLTKEDSTNVQFRLSTLEKCDVSASAVLAIARPR